MFQLTITLVVVASSMLTLIRRADSAPLDNILTRDKETQDILSGLTACAAFYCVFRRLKAVIVLFLPSGRYVIVRRTHCSSDS